MIGLKLPANSEGRQDWDLQVLNQFLLLLEDVLQLSQGGLHLLQRELVLALLRLVLGHPGVELSDGVVQQDPFLHQHLALLHPGLGHGLHLVKSFPESGHLGISLSVSGHLERGSLSSNQDLHVVDTGLVEAGDLVVESLDIVQGGGLGETLGGGLLSSGQPGGELLDTSPVLGPELDVVGVLVALHLGVGLQLLHVLDDPGQLVLEHLGVGGDLLSLGQQVRLGGSAGLEDLQLGGDVLLEIHGPGHSVLGQHGAGGLPDVLQLIGGGVLPGVDGLQGVVEGSEVVHQINDDLNGVLESHKDLQLLLNSLDLLLEDLLLVIGNGDGHGVVVLVDGREQSVDCVLSALQDFLSLGKISICSLKVENLLDLFNFLFSLLKVGGNSFAILSITNESFLGLIQKLQSVLGFLFGVFPSVLDSLDISLQELWFVRVLEDDLSLGNEISDNSPLGIKLSQRFFLPLNELINILNTRWSNVSGGGQHDSVQELNMGLQLITIGVALPVEIHHDSGLLDIGDELLMLLDKSLKLVIFLLLLIFSTLSHQDLQDLGKPFLHFCTFK